MKTVGVIAEYNPFHNGHKYQLDTIRKQTQADYIIVVMSGNFLQRGVLSITDKYTRAKSALLSGADLVLELPVLWATASAEYFASAGIRCLQSLGITDAFAFGAEDDCLSLFENIADILIDNPIEYQTQLRKEMKSGISYPLARANALTALIKEIPATKLSSLLQNPNNILGIEYLKANRHQLEPILIPRKGNQYHDTMVTETLSSATAIRRLIFDKSISSSQLETRLPASSLALLREKTDCCLLREDSLSEMLGYCLLQRARSGYESFADCDKTLSNRIRNSIREYRYFSQFCEQLKTKNITHTRISRVLLHILLDIKKTDYELGIALNYVPYLRVLGFQKNATKLLAAIKRNASAPLITKVADASNILSSDAYYLLEKDIFAADVYNQLIAQNAQAIPNNEFTQPIVIL